MSENSWDTNDYIKLGADFFTAYMNDKDPVTSTSTASSAPWDGIQPYLTGTDTPLDRWKHPVMNYNNLAWNQAVANGQTTEPAPPMFMNDQRMTGWNVATPTNGNDQPVFQEFNPYANGTQVQPQSVPAQNSEPWNPYTQQQTSGQGHPITGWQPSAAPTPDFTNGPFGYGFGGQGLDVRTQMAEQLYGSTQQPQSSGLNAAITRSLEPWMFWDNGSGGVV